MPEWLVMIVDLVGINMEWWMAHLREHGIKWSQWGGQSMQSLERRLDVVLARLIQWH